MWQWSERRSTRGTGRWRWATTRGEIVSGHTRALVRLTVYTTDVDLLFQHYAVLASRLGAAGAAPVTTTLG
jgi:hypothetical protein